MNGRDKDLSQLSSIELQKYGMKHASQFEYRVELARRVAATFKTDHLIILDDIVLTVSKTQRETSFLAYQVGIGVTSRWPPLVINCEHLSSRVLSERMES